MLDDTSRFAIPDKWFSPGVAGLDVIIVAVMSCLGLAAKPPDEENRRALLNDVWRTGNGNSDLDITGNLWCLVGDAALCRF